MSTALPLRRQPLSSRMAARWRAFVGYRRFARMQRAESRAAWARDGRNVAVTAAFLGATALYLLYEAGLNIAILDAAVDGLNQTGWQSSSTAAGG